MNLEFKQLETRSQNNFNKTLQMVSLLQTS